MTLFLILWLAGLGVVASSADERETDEETCTTDRDCAEKFGGDGY